MEAGSYITMSIWPEKTFHDRITILYVTERALIGEIIMDVNVHEIIVLRDKKVQARTHKKKRITKNGQKDTVLKHMKISCLKTDK